MNPESMFIQLFGIHITHVVITLFVIFVLENTTYPRLELIFLPNHYKIQYTLIRKYRIYNVSLGLNY